MNSDEEKFKRHLGRIEIIKIGNDEFKMKPLGASEIPKFFKVVGKMSSLGEKSSPEKIAEVFTEKNVEDLIDLMVKGFSKANPTINKETLKEFVGDNFWDVFQPFIEINGMKEENKKEINERIKEMQKARGMANANSELTNTKLPFSSKEQEK